eukprot:gene7916-12384_t
MKVLSLGVLFLVFCAAISSPVTCVRNDVVATTLGASVQCLFSENIVDPQYWCEANCPGGFVDLQDYQQSMNEFKDLYCKKNVKTTNCPCSGILAKTEGSVKTVLNNAISSECAAINANAGNSGSGEQTGNPSPSGGSIAPTKGPTNSPSNGPAFAPANVPANTPVSKPKSTFVSKKSRTKKKTKKTKKVSRLFKKFGRKGASATSTLEEEANALELEAQQLEEHAEALESIEEVE